MEERSETISIPARLCESWYPLENYAFDPVIIDEDGRIAPRFHYLIGELEWTSIDIQTRVGLILEFVASLESDVVGVLQEIPF